MGIRKIPNDTKTFKFYNANPKNKRSCDCVIRALSLFLDKSWDDVFNDLMEIAFKLKVMPDETECYKKYLKNLGFEMQKQPRHPDNTKYTGEEFCKFITRKDTKYLCHLGGNHIVCIKDKKVHDTWDSTDGCIGNYWVITK